MVGVETLSDSELAARMMYLEESLGLNPVPLDTAESQSDENHRAGAEHLKELLTAPSRRVASNGNRIASQANDLRYIRSRYRQFV